LDPRANLCRFIKRKRILSALLRPCGSQFREAASLVRTAKQFCAAKKLFFRAYEDTAKRMVAMDASAAIRMI
jgi:hypothetical protein